MTPITAPRLRHEGACEHAPVENGLRTVQDLPGGGVRTTAWSMRIAHPCARRSRGQRDPDTAAVTKGATWSSEEAGQLVGLWGDWDMDGIPIWLSATETPRITSTRTSAEVCAGHLGGGGGDLERVLG